MSYLTRLRENGAKLALPAPGREGGGVRILSIHKSKGLEFPGGAPLRAGAEAQPGGHEPAHPVPPQAGGGSQAAGRGAGDGVSHPGPGGRPRAGAGDDGRGAAAALCGHDPGQGEADSVRGPHRRARDLEKLAPDAACPGGAPGAGQVPERGAVGAASPPWPGPTGGPPPGRGVQVPVRRRTSVRPGISALWTGRSSGGPAEAPFPHPVPGRRDDFRGGGEETAALAARLAWHYPHGAEVELPSKLTATQLKGRALDEEVAEAAVRPPGPSAWGGPASPPRSSASPPAQKGTALHLVMQYIDFERTDTRGAGAGREIARLVERAVPHPQQGEAVDPAKSPAFLPRPLGRELMASTSLRREFKFSILVPAADYYPPGRGGSRCSSRAWWTAALRLWRASPWWTSRPTG